MITLSIPKVGGAAKLFYIPNVWPPLPAFRSAVTAYAGEMQGVADRIFSLFERALVVEVTLPCSPYESHCLYLQACSYNPSKPTKVTHATDLTGW
jgi:isopenicillin N synthase-like dioxygenase